MSKFNKLYESILNELNSNTITILPGSFKPPHKGHWDMIQQYSKMSDKVFVIISSPTQSSIRKTNNRKIITPEISKQIFEIFKKSYKLNNVEFQISDKPSPVTAAYDKLSELKNVKVILGSSKKDDDWTRWKNAKSFIDKNNIPVTLLDTEEYSVEPKSINGIDISSSAIRNNIDDFESILSLLPDKLSDKDINNIKSLLT